MTTAQIEMSLTLTKNTASNLHRLAQAQGITNSAVIEQALAFCSSRRMLEHSQDFRLSVAAVRETGTRHLTIGWPTRCRMAYRRGDVIAVPYAYSDLSGGKVRPAVIVSSDAYNRARPDVVAAGITTQIATVGPYDHLLADWATAGLRYPSAMRGSIAYHRANSDSSGPWGV